MRRTLHWLKWVGAMACALAGAVVLSPPALAIIKVELPVAKLVQQSRAVVVGRVSAVDAQRRALDVEVAEKINGDLGGAARFRVLVPEAPGAGEALHGLLESLAVGQPVVLLVSPGGGQAAAMGDAVLHLGDRWVRGARGGAGETPLWRVTGPYDGARSFPGRTEALVRVLADIRTGGKGLQDWVSHEVCLGGVFMRAQTGLAAPTFLLSPDLDGDGTPDVVAGNATEVRVLIAQKDKSKTYADQTAAWGLAGAKGGLRAAAGDFNGDGAIDLVIGAQVWLGSVVAPQQPQKKFVAGPMLELGDSKQWIAMGAGDANGDGRAEVAVLLREGRMRVAQSSGAGGPWTVQDAPLWSDGKEALAGAFAMDFGDDGRLQAIVVRPDAIARYPVLPGRVAAPSSTAAGADTTGTLPVSDFARLTGIALAAYPSLGAMPIQPLLVAAYDYDGLGRTDFILVTQGGGIALANRGHGAFLINRFAHEQFRPGGRDIKMPKLPFEPTLTTALTAPGRQVQMQPKRKRGNLLVLDDKGQLWEMENERKK